jgi:hypothetical protein
MGSGIARRLIALLAGSLAALLAATGLGAATGAQRDATVWLCRPGLAEDPCASSLTATRVDAAGAHRIVSGREASSPRFDCFYVYPTVSGEPSTNADLLVQKSEIAAAVAQASRFSQACRVYAPMYRQVTLAGLAAYLSLGFGGNAEAVAYRSLLAGFEDYLTRYNHGRPIVFIGHSQGAAMLIDLLARKVDDDAALRRRLALAIVLGGDVEVRPGSLTGGSFSQIPVCSHRDEDGCVIAYSSFPGRPPSTSLFGRPGRGVALQSGQTTTRGRAVACVNPAALGGGTAGLDAFFPSQGVVPTPWLEYPGLYRARCETAGGATWLQVTKATGSSDPRPTVTETDGPDWGYHEYDVNLALGDLVRDVESAERAWTRGHHTG